MADQPVVTSEHGRQVYRKPTIYHLSTGGFISERGPLTIYFAHTGHTLDVRYAGEIDQDTLFRVLMEAGLLTRTERTRL